MVPAFIDRMVDAIEARAKTLRYSGSFSLERFETDDVDAIRLMYRGPRPIYVRVEIWSDRVARIALVSDARTDRGRIMASCEDRRVCRSPREVAAAIEWIVKNAGYVSDDLIRARWRTVTMASVR